MGTKTYGKATVQNVARLDDGGALRLTIAKYVTPSGRDIQGQGLEPDLEVEFSSSLRFYRAFIPGRLQKGQYGAAVKLLQEMLLELGYSVSPTGIFDQATASALSRFQAKAGIAVNGILMMSPGCISGRPWRSGPGAGPQLKRAEGFDQSGMWAQLRSGELVGNRRIFLDFCFCLYQPRLLAGGPPGFQARRVANLGRHGGRVINPVGQRPYSLGLGWPGFCRQRGAAVPGPLPGAHRFVLYLAGSPPSAPV